jgi:CheY-like chemotaxis protein
MAERAEALILEDNPREAQEISAVTAACGLETLTTRSPQQAVRLLRTHAPTLALIDWNMALSPDPDRTSEAALKELCRLHPDAYTIVFATNVGTDLTLQERIALAHPSAVTHDKRLGLDSLMTRVRKLLERRLGDLAIDHGCVTHVPTGRRYKHRAAVKMVLAHPRDFYAGRRTATYQAIYAFKLWLHELDSSVSVDSLRAGFYRLVVREEQEADGATAPR